MKRYWFFSVLATLGILGSFFLFKQKSNDEQVTDDGQSDEYSWYI